MSNGTHTFGFPLALANTSGVQPQIEKGTGNPNGVLVRPIGSLFLRTDTAQLWQNTNGISAWTQAAGGSGGSVPNPTPDDYSIQLGATSDMALGYFLAATTGLPADVVALGATLPTALSVSGNNFLPWLRVSTNNADYTGPGAGGTGYIAIQTGEASATAGSVGGSTGYIIISSGSFQDGAGTGGRSGDVTVESGSTDSDVSGDVTLRTGDCLNDNSGQIELATGNSGNIAGDIVLNAGSGVNGGDVQLTAGGSSGGVGGSVILQAGSGTTNSGDIRFESGIQPSPNTDTVSYNDPLAYGVYKSRTYIVGTGPGVSTLQFVPKFQGEIEMVLVRNANVGAGDTLALTINGTNVFAPGGVAGPLTQAGGTLISGDQYLPRLNGSGTLFNPGNTIQIAYNAAGASGGAMVSIFVRRRN